jgi:hypothetical protein
MSMLKRLYVALFLAAASIAPIFAQQRPEPARDQFLPVDQLPPSERMPSAPYVVAAYAVVWILAMFYMWTIWKREGKLEADMETLARRQRDAAR